MGGEHGLGRKRVGVGCGWYCGESIRVGGSNGAGAVGRCGGLFLVFFSLYILSSSS